jgi:ubiquinone/menaquinone biosynthesis C-methylase UbiE
MATVDKGSLFSSEDIADAYMKFRPTYGPEVYNAIVKYCNESPSSNPCTFELAVDLGCGSGQSTIPLAKCFGKVIGIDTSKEQIARAPTHIPNLEFRTGPAEDLSQISPDSTDLVTVAQAMHWMDTDKLYPNVTRILKPGGAFIVFGYGLVSLDNPKAQETLTYVSCPISILHFLHKVN